MTKTASAVVWQDISSALPSSHGWMHSGVAVEPDGTILCAHPEGHAFLRIPPEGSTTVVTCDLTELHAIAATTRGVIGVADPGHRFVPGAVGEDYGEEQVTGRAALISPITGDIALELYAPAMEAYAEKAWSPTSIAFDDSPGGSGDIWVADGYGANLVHRYSADGDHMATYDGTATGRPFQCPHGIAIHVGANGTQVYIADRSNKRIVILAVDGTITHVFGEGELDSPSSIAFVGDELYVTELFGGVAHYTADGKRLGTIEPHRTRHPEEPGWPNVYGSDGTPTRPTSPTGFFNSPHGIVHHGGSLYITEWHIGGRLLRLAWNAEN